MKQDREGFFKNAKRCCVLLGNKTTPHDVCKDTNTYTKGTRSVKLLPQHRSYTGTREGDQATKATQAAFVAYSKFRALRWHPRSTNRAIKLGS